MSNSFGSLDAGSDSERDFSDTSFLSAIGSVPISIGGGHHQLPTSGAPSPISSSYRNVSNRSNTTSLGMFDMEGIDDLNEDNDNRPFHFSDDEDKEDTDDEKSADDQEDNAEDGDETDDEVQHAEAAEEGIVGSLHVGSFARRSYFDQLENEENQEQISNLPIKINTSKKSNSRTHRRSSASGGSTAPEIKQYAQSLPISIPNWKPLNNHQIFEDSDLDWMSVKDNPECIAESIKALARSVRDGTEMFGDLPTRKFTASDLVKARPN